MAVQLVHDRVHLAIEFQAELPGELAGDLDDGAALQGSQWTDSKSR